MADEEDPYAVSSDSEDEGTSKKPPPKIHIEGRESGDINQLKAAAEKSALLTETKEVVQDESRKEELEQLKQAKDTKKMKQDFESGSVVNKTEEELAEAKAVIDEERQKLTELSKEKYSKFKDRFENSPLDSTSEENLEEKLKRMEKEMVGLGKESLASAKQKFEKGEGDVEIQKTQLEDIERSADMKKMKAAFNRTEMTADEAPKECALCQKIVYPVERVFANKQLYHVNCFKCNKCAKKLSPTNFNSHQGILLCKVHMLEVFHPELARTMDPTNTEEDEHADADDDDEFAVSSKPKHLQGVVRAGASAVQDELAQIKSLKDKKGDFESSVKEASNVEKKTKVDEDLLQTGRVKANTERFVSGAALEGSEGEEEPEGDRDPNIIREDKKQKKEQLHFEQIGDIKNKWKTGDVEGAEQKDVQERKELEDLKGGPSVKERFQERSEADKVVERQWDKSELDTAAAAEARKSFMEGGAYQATAVEKSATDLGELKFNQLKGFKDRFEKGEEDSDVQKTAVDVDVQLGSIKAAFEKPAEEEMSPEERAAQKKREIEAEFLRYKLARRAAAERTKQQEEEGVTPVVVPGDDAADVGSIKDRFDKGDAFKSQGQDGKELDVEFKMAGKAREKFKQIDASGASPVQPGQNKKSAEPSKWDKKDDKPVAEVINRREQQDDDAPEDDDAFDVKNLMNKFKNIGEGGASSAKSNSEQRAELEGLKTEAKSFKQRFEKGAEGDDDIADEKKRQMQEEFEALKKEREEAQRQLDEERAQEEGERQTEKEDINIKADHASKMAAKWEKIQAKEAKKAEKGKMPDKKTTTRFVMREQPKCDVCTKSVYVAEQFQCFGLLYHVQCFRCNVCRQALRVEKVHRSSTGGLLCPVHFRLSEEVQKPKNTEENNNEMTETSQITLLL